VGVASTAWAASCSVPDAIRPPLAFRARAIS